MKMEYLLKKNKSRVIFTLAILTTAWTVISASCPQESFQAKTTKHFLWSAKRGKSTIYLLGSIHLLTKESSLRNRTIENAYGDSKEIVFEIDLDSLQDPAFQSKMTILGLAPEGQSIRQYVSAQTYARLQQRVSALGLPMEPFTRLRPWLCALTLTSLELQRLGLDPNFGVDQYFFDRAKQDGKKVSFLESVDDQLKLFTEMSKEEEELFLAKVLMELETMRAKVGDMINAWKDGNTNKLASIVEQEFKNYPDIYSKMLVQRNEKWVEQIETLSKQNGNKLVIVGAAHFVGDKNVLELLESKGFELEQR